MIEYGKLTPLAKAMLIENLPPEKRLARASVKLDELPLTDDDEPTRDGVCRDTNMRYYISYSPIVTRKSKKYGLIMDKASFQIICDLFYPKGVARFSNWDEFYNSPHPVARWLVRNTNVSKRMFEIAREHVYLCVPFCINYTAYLKKAKRLRRDYSHDFKGISKE